MKETRIVIDCKTISKMQSVETMLKENGFKKTSDCYWTSIFVRDDVTAVVNLEEAKEETPESEYIQIVKAEADSKTETSTAKVYTPERALKCAEKDFGKSVGIFLNAHPIETGEKNYYVEWKLYDKDGEHTEALYAVGVKDCLTAKSIAIVATCGTCGNKLKYVEY